jgi:hypothetical protein
MSYESRSQEVNGHVLIGDVPPQMLQTAIDGTVDVMEEVKLLRQAGRQLHDLLQGLPETVRQIVNAAGYTVPGDTAEDSAKKRAAVDWEWRRVAALEKWRKLLAEIPTYTISGKD